MARIDNLTNFLTDVATAIKAKTGKTEAITPANFDTEISSIESGGKYSPSFITFYGAKSNDLSYEVENLDTSRMTTMLNMFRGNKITELNINHFDVSNVTNLGGAFSECSNLVSLDISSWNIENCTSTMSMFSRCSSLTEINMSGCVTKQSIGTNYMFADCTALKFIDMRNFDFSKITTYPGMFENVPTDCEIIVKDDTQKTWITSKFTTLTNVKTVAEVETV